MIHTYTPYCPKKLGKNLGWAYNNFMEMVHDNDWVCFVDHDAMFTIPNWYTTLEGFVWHIENGVNKDIGLLTAVCNRIGNVEQILFDKNSTESQNHDMYFHRKIGNKRYEEYGKNFTVKNANNLISGILMLTPKRVWKEVGGFKDGFLSVDNDYDKKIRSAGYKTAIMLGIYMYHWYRADGVPMQGWGYNPNTNLEKI